MFRLGIIEESLKNRQILETLKPYLFLQKIQNNPEDEYPVWHVNEYRIDDKNIIDILEILKEYVKETWYIHAFNQENLYVVLKNKWFRISLSKDETWNEMIEYGVNTAKVERKYLERIPLYV